MSKRKFKNFIKKSIVSMMVVAMLFMFDIILPVSNSGSFIPGGPVYTEAAAVTYYPPCSKSCNSIVDGLKSIGVDSSYANRKQIASLNGYSNYTGTAAQNNNLLSLLKQGKLIRSKSNPVPQNTTQFQYPMSGFWTTQGFGAYSSSMAKKGRAYHCGIDIKSNNTRVNAAADGTIKYRGYTSGNGNHVVMQHTFNGTTVYTLYSHLANFNGCPSVGSRVSKGSQIGVMGNTGNSTGPHLHFGIFTGAYSSDPVGYTNVNNSNKAGYNGRTFYNPNYVISNNRLP